MSSSSWWDPRFVSSRTRLLTLPNSTVYRLPRRAAVSANLQPQSIPLCKYCRQQRQHSMAAVHVNALWEKCM